MNLKDMNIATRLVLGFSLMGALIALLGVLAVLRINGIGEQFSVVNDNRYPKVAALNGIALANAANARALRDLVLRDTPAARKPLLEEMAENSKLINDRFSHLERTVVTPEGLKHLEAIKRARAAYITPRDKVRKLVNDGDLAGARAALNDELHPAQLRYQAAADAFIRFEEAQMLAGAHEVERGVASSRMTIIGIVGAALVLAAVAGVWIVRSVTRPLQRAVGIARSVAGGDLATPIDVHGSNETAQLLAALRDMQGRLTALVGEVRAGAESVATASAQIAQGNNDLSARTETQAGALEETAASMDELTATVRQNADHARQADALSRSASDVAVRGGTLVQQVVQTMNGISDSSRRVVEITGVIDGIAFQTNILALNAAVEAARAGQHGRGFAVVAGEVRTLSQRCADAAKEIKALIAASAAQVQAGARLVDEAGTTMHDVVASVSKVSDIISQISTASGEQSANVAQVAQAVMQMDQATQQNAALVEQSAAAAESLHEQSGRLVRTLSAFRLAA